MIILLLAFAVIVVLLLFGILWVAEYLMRTDPIDYTEIVDELEIEPTRLFNHKINGATVLDIAKIQGIETALGFEFPGAMRDLYLFQNGGYLYKTLFRSGQDTHYLFVQAPLMQMERMETAYEHMQIYNNADDPYFAAWFIPESKKMVTLCLDHQDMLFLDYNQSGPPRVGLSNFTENDWYAQTIWWENFESFLSSCRRYERVEI